MPTPKEPHPCRSHVELAGAGEAGVAAGSQILTVQDLRIEEIADVIHRRIGGAAGPSTIAVSGDLDPVRVDIGTDRPGVVFGHGGAGADRLRAELQELTGKPVMLNVVDYPGPREGRRGMEIRPGQTLGPRHTAG